MLSTAGVIRSLTGTIRAIITSGTITTIVISAMTIAMIIAMTIITGTITTEEETDLN